MGYRYYRGCYIGNGAFRSKAEVDRFLEENAVAHYKLVCELFAEVPSVEHASLCNEEAERLVNQFGYSYEQLEEIEAEVFRTVDVRRA